MSDRVQEDAVVIGGGPAGLAAAEMLAAAGRHVTVYEAKPSVGRKFLMAGKSGLNLTNAAPFDDFLAVYEEAAPQLAPILRAFDGDAVQDWARGLGQEVFAGSTGRVFPRAMKASPLLRAWLARLAAGGVQIRTRQRWCGWRDGALLFRGEGGAERAVLPRVTVLALGGASWARLGSDGAWRGALEAAGVAVAPFRPANAGLAVDWSAHMARHFGTPVKGIALTAGGAAVRGEIVVSEKGLEGGGVYAVFRDVREGAALFLDLAPDVARDELAARAARRRAKESVANTLRKAFRLSPVKAALVQEFGRPLPSDPAALAALVKALPVRHAGPRPIDEAISVAGGISWNSVDEKLMLRALPGVFVAGEMLDWEASTGGYLLSACFATGRWAGQHAANFSASE